MKRIIDNQIYYFIFIADSNEVVPIIIILTIDNSLLHLESVIYKFALSMIRVSPENSYS